VQPYPGGWATHETRALLYRQTLVMQSRSLALHFSGSGLCQDGEDGAGHASEP